MKMARFIIWSGIVVLMLQSSCKSPTEPTSGVFVDTHVRGQVTRSDGQGGVGGVTVRDVSLTTVSTTADSSGRFDLLYSLDQKYDTRITAVANGFINHVNDTISVSITPGTDISNIGIVLGVDSSSPPPGTSTSGIPASIILIGSGTTNLSIRGTGSNETTILTFEVRDSLGLALSAANKVTVRFQLLGGPGGGEYVNPTSATTDTKGRVSTRVNSGSRAGVVQIYAYARNDSVVASPVKVTISGGLPYPGNMTVTPEKHNVAAGNGVLAGDNIKVGIQVLMGDQFGNPVPQDIAVAFSTNGGLISPNSATNNEGVATATLTTGNPRPPLGIATIRATTVGDSGATVTSTTNVVFSGATNIILPGSAFPVPDSGSTSISYQVQDQYGNPLEGGSTISVSVSGDAASALTLERDFAVTIPDTRDTSYTNFNVVIAKKKPGPPGGIVTLKVSVTSPNNPTSSPESKSVNVSVSASGGGTSPLPPGVIPSADKMELVGVSKQSIIVNDGSNSDKSLSTITFLVKDSVGNPLINVNDPSKAKVYVTFAVQGFSPQGVPVSGGEQILVPADSTNEFSQVSTRLLAGTRSGIFKVTATIAGGPAYNPAKGTIDAIGEVVIKSGPPDASHFGVFPTKFNFGGLEIISEDVKDGLTAAVGDKFGNPVEAGTRVYFDAVHGFVAPEAVTNINGFLTVNLLAALPKPVGAFANVSYGGSGWGLVRARTIGEGNVELKDSVLILWTGKPIVTVTSGPGSFTVANGGSDGPWTFTLLDYLGHPMTSGTIVNVTAGGARVFGNVNKTLLDYTTTGNGITDFTFSVADADPTDTDPPVVSVLVITIIHPVYGTSSYTVATGTVD